ncbi:hypothetical protein D9M68_789890 [compost metagenome]
MGHGWTRALPGVGVGKAQAVERFLAAHADTLGRTIGAHAGIPRRQRYAHELARVVPSATALVPLDKLVVPAALDGAPGPTAARRPSACWPRPMTTRPCSRGCRSSRISRPRWPRAGVPHAATSAAFTGPPVSRSSGRWRPFAPGGLAAASRRYAVRALRAAFDWLVNVRYLAGNPWRVVRDPVTVQRATSMRIERALPIDLWKRVRAEFEARAIASDPSAERWRIAVPCCC